MPRSLAAILEWLYTYDSVRELKDRVRPLKHWLVGKGDIYYVVDAIKQSRRVRTPDAPVRLVLDVGAAWGDKTVTFLRAFPDASVYCFEPQARSRMRLARRVARWSDRVRVYPYGLFREDRQVPLRLYSYWDASSLLPISEPMRQGGKREVGVEQITVRRLDACLEELRITRIDLLKIDVEGVEREVLEGADEALRRTDNVFIEIAGTLRKPVPGDDERAVFEMLADHGFHFMGQYGDFWFSKDPAVLETMESSAGAARTDTRLGPRPRPRNSAGG